MHTSDIPARPSALADMLNELGATLGFKKGTNREIVVLPATVDFDTVEIGGARAHWSNDEKGWTPA